MTSAVSQRSLQDLAYLANGADVDQSLHSTRIAPFAEIGLGLTAFGFMFTILGMLMLFDRGLIAMGNLLFVAGLATTIGFRSMLTFFMKRKNRQVRPNLNIPLDCLCLQV